MGNHKQPQGGIEKIAKRLCSVYGLYSTEDGIIRYIGQTAQPLKRRLIQHFASAKRHEDLRSYRWIRKALRDGYDIGIFLLEADCPWNEAECRWISDYNREYPGILTNTSEGGCGYTGKRPEWVKAKMRGPKSEAHKAAMRKPKSAEVRVKMSLAQIGNTKCRGVANRTAVLTELDVILIRKRLAEGERGADIAREYGLQRAAISKIKTGRSWTHVAS